MADEATGYGFPARTYSKHLSRAETVDASPQALFARLDDHSRLSSHMTGSSWMMAGSRMRIETDERRGKAVGSHILLSGAVLGMPLFVDEVVTVRDPPFRKAWETVGAPSLIVIGHYRLGFAIEQAIGTSMLTVSIDYDVAGGLLGRLFGDVYARWCVTSMVRDAVNHFGKDKSRRREGAGK